MIGKLILVEKYDQYMGGVDFSYQFTSYYDLKVCKMVEKVVLSKVIVVLMYKPYNILLCSNYTMNYFNGHPYLAVLFCYFFSCNYISLCITSSLFCVIAVQYFISTFFICAQYQVFHMHHFLLSVCFLLCLLTVYFYMHIYN